jgi:hypothetical protein
VAPPTASSKRWPRCSTVIRARSKAGVDAEIRVYQVYRVRDGMIAFVTAYSSREPALAAVGL